MKPTRAIDFKKNMEKGRRAKGQARGGGSAMSKPKMKSGRTAAVDMPRSRPTPTPTPTPRAKAATKSAPTPRPSPSPAKGSRLDNLKAASRKSSERAAKMGMGPRGNKRRNRR